MIQCEVLEKAGALGNTLRIGYKYKFHGDKTNKYKAEFKIDVVKPGPRFTWMHKDDCKFDYRQENKAYS